ncbi:MAG: XDD4 family exosortase-dependent surface protein, partial [Planctomycetota bacterium]
MIIYRANRMRFLGSFAAAIPLLLVAGSVHAAEVSQTINLTNGTQSGSAQFTFNDTTHQLDIVLTNTMTTNGGPQWLTGAFFNIAGNPILTDASAAGNLITLSGTTQSNYAVAGAEHFWAYRGDIANGELPSPLFGSSDQRYGVGSAGFGVFGNGDIIGLDPNGPLPQPDGTDGGILADITGLSVPNGHEGTPFVLGSLML